MADEIENYIKSHFSCSDGVIYRDDRKNSSGSLDKDGYLILKIKGRQYKAHRVVWLLYNGSFPDGEIDHINRNRLDNRIENLRISNRKQQADNKTYYPNKNTNVIGVYYDRTNGLKKNYATKYCRKTYRFASLEEAVDFRKERGLRV